MFQIKKITEQDAIKILNKDEDHFFDVVTRAYSGEAVQKKCVAFANTDGGELLIGIHDKKQKDLSGGKFERWNGFPDQESANSVINDIYKNIEPCIAVLSIEFIEIINYESLGKILKVSIEKSPNVHNTMGKEKKVYIRRGAQCILLNSIEITNLRLAKGEKSYEDQCVSGYNISRLLESTELINFLRSISPQTNPRDFLRKQNLIHRDSENPVYAGVLLYDENPSTILQKNVP